MGYYGALWGTLGHYGALWGTIGHYGVLWALWSTMGYYGVLWGTMGYYGHYGVLAGTMGYYGFYGVLCGTMGYYKAVCLAPPAGTFCNRTWDGWLCWGDAEPGTVLQMCPEYFQDFDPAGMTLNHTHVYERAHARTHAYTQTHTCNANVLRCKSVHVMP